MARFLCDPIVGDLDLLLVLLFVVHQVRALADEQVFVGHGVVVIGVDLERLVEAFRPPSITGSYLAFSSSRTFLSLIGPGSSCFMPRFARAVP